jgi:DNA-binding transcriptional regulator YhcF (GntR family)
MNEGWVKLHRRLNENDLLTDTTALGVFIWLLINVDRKTGSMKIGRFWLAKTLSLNPNTLYKALKRLEKKYKMVTQSSNSQFTKISLVNWSKYQSGNSVGNNQVTTGEQPSNTLQEVENKEVKKETSAQYLLTVPKEDVEVFTSKYQCSEQQLRGKAEEMYNYCLAKGKKYSNYRALLSNAVRKDFGVRVVLPVVIQDDPSISDEQAKKNLERLDKMRKGLLN